LKRFSLLAAASFFFLQVAFSGPMCGVGSLTNYEALGSGGCTVNGDTVFSFAGLSGISGATELNPNLITITPGGGAGSPLLTFSTTQSTVVPTLLESIFTYQISGISFTDVSTVLSSSSETVDGAVTETLNFCAGGTFGPDGVTGCTGSATGGLNAIDGVQNEDDSTLPGTSTLAITNDFVLDPGNGGTAAGGTFTNQFTDATSVPEPSTYLLMAASGLALAGLGKRRSSKRR
jgi:hypothetical protein